MLSFSKSRYFILYFLIKISTFNISFPHSTHSSTRRLVICFSLLLVTGWVIFHLFVGCLQLLNQTQGPTLGLGILSSQSRLVFIQLLGPPSPGALPRLSWIVSLTVVSRLPGSPPPEVSKYSIKWWDLKLEFTDWFLLVYPPPPPILLGDTSATKQTMLAIINTQNVTEVCLVRTS